MKIKLYISIFLYLFLTACISPFEPEGIKDTAGILVVEGMILEPVGTHVKLSRTIALSSDDPFDYVTHAQVRVLGDNGIVYKLEHQASDPGMYLYKDSFLYEPNVLYAVEIQVDNKQYQSDFLSPTRTPEIDKLSWSTKEGESILDIQISTHDPQNEVKYFRWVYEEDWEIKSGRFSSYYWDAENKRIADGLTLYSSFNRYYCWAKDKSKKFLLGNTDKLSSATIKDKTLVRHKVSERDTRFSFLYSILVKQYGISSDAFDYFQNLQKNIEESGSLFAPLPTEMDGNIRCINNPEEPVIGFIVASTEETSRLYISIEEVPEMQSPYNFCAGETFFPLSDTFAAAAAGLEPYSYYEDEEKKGYYWISRYCVNCLAFPGATKNKPEWWPNDHE